MAVTRKALCHCFKCLGVLTSVGVASARAQSTTDKAIGRNCHDNSAFRSVTNSNSHFAYTPRQIQIGFRFF